MTQMSDVFDVIVIGAGPAGSLAAQKCAEGGLRVALIERKENPSLPVRCGEGIGFKGMASSIGIRPEWILATVKRVVFVSPTNRRVPVHQIGESFCVDRRIMDRDIMNDAIAAGAQLFNNTFVTDVQSTLCKESGHTIYHCHTADQIFSAPILIAADGVESTIRRQVGWSKPFSPEDIETCAFAHVEHPNITADTIEFYTGEDRSPGGYVWVFPRGNGTANIGLGVLGSRSKPGMSQKLLMQFIETQYPDAKISNMHCGGVPVGRWISPLSQNGVLLVGDTAGQVNALNGGGIAYALFAGKIAGETVVEAFQNKKIHYPTLQKYEKRWNKYCGKNQMRSYVLKTMLLKRANTFYDDVAKALENENPETLSYRRVFMKVFARHPLLLLKTFFLFR